MKKLAISLLFSGALFAQTADVAYFRAVMLPSNEVPANTQPISGVATIIAHVVRDSTNQITSGTVQFMVRTTLTGTEPKTATGLHIHTGAAGVNGGVVIGTALSGTNTLAIPAGASLVNLPVQIPEGTTPSVALTNLRALFNDPSQFYVNIHTVDFGGGIMRGQLTRAIGTVLMGVMSADNEVPPTGIGGRGMATVVAIGTYNSAGELESGETYLQTTYQLDDGGTFTGFHIHNGVAGMNAGVIINTGLPAGIPVNPAGGVLGPYYVEINKSAANGAVQVATFNSLFTNPTANYINAHTTLHTGGAIRAQLRTTDSIVLPVMMDSAKEPFTVNSKGTAPALITLRTLRNEDGSVAAGTVFFDVNYRFTGEQSFTGLHIHDEPSGVVSINMVPANDALFSSATGFGNYFNWTPGVENLGTLEDIIKNPENHYVNIHTTTDPGGAARGQLGSPLSGPAQIDAVIAANNDKAATTVAPGGLISIYGLRLVKVASDLSGWAGRTLPTSFNGTSVTIAGRAAPIVYVGPGQINAQVPVDVPLGQQPVVINNGRGPSAAFMVMVTPVAPAIFFSPVAAVLKNSDFSLVSQTNPARVGDVLLVYATGLGQTTPAIATGGLVTGTANTATVTAMMGTRNATVVYSIASPGFAGLNQVAVTVPEGVSGSVPLVLTQGTAKSNTVNIQVQ